MDRNFLRLAVRADLPSRETGTLGRHPKKIRRDGARQRAARRRMPQPAVRLTRPGRISIVLTSCL